MRYSLIEMVQRILGAMDSDEVNDIADSTEALEVAKIIKECYFEIMSEVGPKNTKNLFHLDASTDHTKPVLMFLPGNVAAVEWLKYNTGTSGTDSIYRDIQYITPREMYELTDDLDSTQNWVQEMDITLSGSIFQFKFRNDNFPHFYTSTDDKSVIFDAYNNLFETTLTTSRTLGYGSMVPVFEMSNTFVPDLDPRMFTLLINSAKAQSFVELKQTTNDRATRLERRHKALAFKDKDATDDRSAVQKQIGFGRRTCLVSPQSKRTSVP
jgi:hypothetical protein